MSNRVKIRLFAVIAIVLLCIGSVIKSFQNDTFYVIKLGEFISRHGVDLLDHYCWVTDLSYTYPHWLYDLFIYLIYSPFGYLGVYISTIVLFIVLIFSVYIIQLKVNKNEFLALFVSILTILSLSSFATARAHLISTILLLWQVYFIRCLIATGHKRYIFILTIISLLVANLHATIWVFCFVLYLPFLGEALVNCLMKVKKLQNMFRLEKNASMKITISKIEHLKELLVSMCLGFAMGLFTPSRICYSYVFKVMMGNSQDYIMEHAPMVIIENPGFMFLILVGLLILIFSETKIKLNELFMIAGLLLMSLVSVRHVAFFYTIGLLYLSILGCRYLTLKKDYTLDILGKLLVRNKVIYILLIVVIAGFSYTKFLENDKFDYVPQDEYPVKAVNYMKKNLDVSNIRLYNDYNIGAYLLFQDIPVFVDSRCDLYLKEFNGLDYSIFDIDMKIVRDYEKEFKRFNVSHVLIDKSNMLYLLLKKDMDYTVLYQDKDFVLFERNSYEEMV